MNKSKRTKRIKNKKTKKIRNKKTKKIRNKKSMGGVKIYNMNGTFTTDPKILHNGKDFFRKMTDNAGEKEICELLMKHPHKNIIQIYGVGKDYIVMELLNTDMSRENMSSVKNVMMEVKTYLQNLGIIYIDWKLDNIGIGENQQIRLFDFDGSGLIDIETKEWIRRPPLYWSYREAIKNGMKTPSDIDNCAFDLEFRRI
jgi:serine/threonine protein kinase